MGVPRAKKKKKKLPPNQRPAKTPFEIVKTSSYLNLAVFLRTMKMVYEWNNEQLSEFMESYIALMSEVGERSTVAQFIKDTTELTGIDIVKELDVVYGGR